ncbi:hypothetical protein ABZ654_35120 [Streptomyces hygroscopicus]|uniref:hypothetical protein n=1 Tax=Streptomyces hygroscopicus TaxID=1912 RepID=UPI0033D7F373
MISAISALPGRERGSEEDRDAVESRLRALGLVKRALTRYSRSRQRTAVVVGRSGVDDRATEGGGAGGRVEEERADEALPVLDDMQRATNAEETVSLGDVVRAEQDRLGAWPVPIYVVERAGPAADDDQARIVSRETRCRASAPARRPERQRSRQPLGRLPFGIVR